MSKIKNKLLLHICCIGCGAYVSDLLKSDFNIKLFFYNPNIYPESEHDKRLEEIKRVADKYELEIICAEYNHESWLEKVRGLEDEPEKGRRCLICYDDRLRETAKTAKEGDFAYFTSTLTVSPHKDAKAISNIGQGLAKEYGVNFLDKDFKKQDGFKKACAVSRELNLYRQNYCGCEFSIIAE
jgi:predicted adenine nucleotide alpha hydrolase (AANH) superfamily ATPase